MSTDRASSSRDLPSLSEALVIYLDELDFPPAIGDLHRSALELWGRYLEEGSEGGSWDAVTAAAVTDFLTRALVELAFVPDLVVGRAPVALRRFLLWSTERGYLTPARSKECLEAVVRSHLR